MTVWFVVSVALAQDPAPRDSAEVLAAGHHRYGVEHGSVTYRITGAGEGTQTITWDRFGWREAQVMEVAFDAMGQTLRHRSRAWIDGEWMVVESEPGQAFRVRNPSLSALDDAAPLQVDDASMIAAGAVRTGEETLLGHRCTIWASGDDAPGMACLYEGILLHSSATDPELGITVEVTATAIDLSSTPDSAAVAVPGDLVLASEELSLPSRPEPSGD